MSVSNVPALIETTPGRYRVLERFRSNQDDAADVEPSYCPAFL